VPSSAIWLLWSIQTILSRGVHSVGRGYEPAWGSHSTEGNAVETWLIIVIVVAVFVVLALLLLAGTRAREKRLESRRSEAGELRGEAEARARRAEESEALAKEEAERARQEREAARAHARQADEIDPDVET
jgi:flagellar biosynthesis/type III secretory pathway M-ring protein FliF/YscJ